MPIRTGGTAPYAPPQTVLHVIEQFRERGLAAPITETVLLKASVSESLAPRTLAALKVLDLLDVEGNPTAEMEGLRRAKSAEFATRLEAIIRSVYAEVFQYTDPAKDDATKIADAFRDYEPAGQRARMVTLFLGLCVAAGIVPENGVAKKLTAERKGRFTRKRPHGPSNDREPAARGDSTGLDPVLASLLRKLPADGGGWTKEGRQAWLETFTTVLDFTVPVQLAPAVPSDEQDDDA